MPKNVIIYTWDELVDLARRDAQTRTEQVILASKIETTDGRTEIKIPIAMLEARTTSPARAEGDE